MAEEQQEQEPFLHDKDYDEDIRTIKSSVDPSRVPTTWRSFGLNCMVHTTLIAIYTICSIAAIHTLPRLPSQTCK